MNGGTPPCLSVVLSVNRFIILFLEGKKTLCKTFIYNRNEYVMKTLVLYVWKRNELVMKNISALLYICRFIYYYVHVYVLMIYLCVYFLCRILSLYIQSIVGLDVADINYHSYRTRSLGYIIIGPCLNYFVRTPIWGFVFIRWLSLCHYFISHSVIVINSIII